MDIAITGMKDIGDAQVIFLGHPCDNSQNLRHLSAWDDPILSTIVRRQTPDCTECAFAALPQRHPLGIITCDPHFPRMVLLTHLHNLRGLGIEPGSESIELDNQDRAGISRKAKAKSRF